LGGGREAHLTVILERYDLPPGTEPQPGDGGSEYIWLRSDDHEGVELTAVEARAHAANLVAAANLLELARVARLTCRGAACGAWDGDVA
jgi:hypothetical protein